jgi:DNA replication and repair protein RecF
VHLERLYADGLRNLSEVRLEPHRRLTAFLGDNGQGKTNLLESVHLAASLRPLRKLERTRDLIRFGGDAAIVRGDFDLDGPLDIEVRIEARGKKATVAGKAVREVAEVAARIGVVAFTPEDLAVVRAGPDMRRRALDQFAYGLSPVFGEVARRYEHTLERRNRLLKQPSVDPSLLEAYTEPFLEAAVALARARHTAAAAWAPVFREAATAITDDAVDATVAYACTFASEEGPLADDERALHERLAERLAGQRDAERQRRTTLSGPHLDDMRIALGDRRARHVASQGEARALVLALKLAAVRLYTERRGTAPLLLLDDVAGELDPRKAACLFDTALEVNAQTFVTATHADVLPQLSDARLVHIREGRIERVEDG